MIAVGELEITDAVNREVWENNAAFFEHLIGWIDQGEEASLNRVADDVRGLPILDLGVGAGRTTPLLRLLTRDYIGIDYTVSMIAAARRRHPSERFVLADARDLSAFPDAHFGLVFFSFNGIDAVGHDDRVRILKEARRVLRPGGYFVFNSHNHDGPSFTDRPWNLRPLAPMATRRVIYNAIRRLWELPGSTKNFRRLQRDAFDAGTHGLYPSASHQFGIVVAFVSMKAQIDSLRTAGFDSIAVLRDHDGAAVDANADTSANAWLYYVARVNA